jgi:MGT family glycosyltransferase
MSKIAIINIGAHGHINPTLAMTSELLRQGHKVTYYTSDEFNSVIQSTGATFRAYQSNFSQNVPQPTADGFDTSRFPIWVLTEAKNALPNLLTMLEADLPDVICFDALALAGKLAAIKLGIRAVRLCPSYAGNENWSLMKSSPDIKPPTEELKSEAATILRDIGSRHGLALTDFPTLFMTPAELNLVFMPRMFQPMGDTFDDRFAFVGPQIAKRTAQTPFAMPAGDKPILFISLGTVFNQWPDFFKMCFEAFADIGMTVIMAIGQKTDPRSLGVIPANFHIYPQVPQLEVLATTDVFISHGGMNSTMESMTFGVPVVIIPQMAEQAATARRVQELKCGIHLPRQAVSVEALQNSLRELRSDNSYRGKASIIGDAARDAGGYKKSADVISRFIAMK